MKQINLIYENILKSLVKEGGNAVPGVDRIEKRYIQRTINSFKKNIIIPFLGFDPAENLFILGSTGKKPDSGDIDLALNQSILNGSILYNLIKLNERCTINGILSCINTINYNMLHIAYPQSGGNKKVQIDLLITKYPEFTKFFMFSPTPQESKYKGAHRNQLLSSIAKILSYRPLEFDENKNVVKWEQNDITDDGFYSMVKTLVDEDGKRLKYKSTNEDLEERIC